MDAREIKHFAKHRQNVSEVVTRRIKHFTNYNIFTCTAELREVDGSKTFFAKVLLFYFTCNHGVTISFEILAEELLLTTFDVDQCAVVVVVLFINIS